MNKSNINQSQSDQSSNNDTVRKYYEIRSVGGFNIIIANYNNFNYPYHSHEFNELVVVFGGTGLHMINKETYNMIAGDVFALKARDEHSLINTNDLIFCNLIFAPDKLALLPEEVKNLTGFQALFQLEPLLRSKPKYSSRFRLNSSQLVFVQNLVQTMEEEFNSEAEASESLLNALFTQLVIYLCRQYSRFADENISPSYNIARAVSLIESNYHEELSLSRLAAVANVSVNQFLLIFQDTFHISPMQYLKQLRVSKACTLLKDSRCNITEIANIVGLSDSSYFSRVFKNVMGITPREYKKVLTRQSYAVSHGPAVSQDTAEF